MSNTEDLARTIAHAARKPDEKAEFRNESAATTVRSSESARIEMIDLTLVDESPYQPRSRRIGKSDVLELMASIEATGQTSPITVSPAPDGRFVVHSGHRRCAALRFLERSQVSAIVRTDLDERAARRLAVADNLGREDLSAYDQAVALDGFRKAYNLTLEKTARELGVSTATASRLSALMEASDDVQKAVRRHGISAYSAGLLADLDRRVSARRVCDLATRLAQGELSVKALKAMCDRARAKTNGKESARQSAAAKRRGVDLVIDDKHLSLRVEIRRDGEPPTEAQCAAVTEAVARMLGVLGIPRVEALASGDHP